jgi:hypothetical protein
MKVTILYPPDITSEEVHNLHLLYFQVLEKLSGEIDVQVIGRISEVDFRRTVNTKLPYVNLFDHPAFKRNLSRQEIEFAESQMGIPFGHVNHCNERRWHWMPKPDNEKSARYVFAWKELLKGTDVLIPSFDNLFFIYSAIGVADRMGVKIMKFIRGRLINDSVIFWDKNNLPIYYKSPLESKHTNETFRRFLNRNETKAIVRKDTKAFGNPIASLLAIPKKAMMLQAGGYDIDVPHVIQKYIRLLEMGMRIAVYPHIHRLSYSHPQEGERYFLFPLHFEWEANLAYREPFVDQMELACAISLMLPVGTRLYIKPHPHWKNCDQGIWAIHNLAGQPNIRIVPPDTNTTELIEKSIGVITINSTVGYEALLLRKPLVVLGHEAYSDVGIDVKDIAAELPSALLDISDSGVSPSTILYAGFLKRYSEIITPIDDIDKLAFETKLALKSLVIE